MLSSLLTSGPEIILRYPGNLTELLEILRLPANVMRSLRLEFSIPSLRIRFLMVFHDIVAESQRRRREDMERSGKTSGRVVDKVENIALVG